MIQAKALLSVGVMGAGVTALAIGVYTQTQPSAFTTQKLRTSTAAPAAIAVKAAIPVVRAEDLPVLPPEPVQATQASMMNVRGHALRPKPLTPKKQPECNSEWRDLESGRGRVRMLCLGSNGS